MDSEQRGPALVEGDVTMQVRGCGGPIAWLLQLLGVTDMDFNIGTLQGVHLGFRSQGRRPSRGRIQLAAVTVVDVYVLRHV